MSDKKTRKTMSELGKVGGKAKNPKKGFGSNRKLASEAGRKGGKISKRPSKKTN